MRHHGPSRPLTIIGGAEGEEDLALLPAPSGEPLPAAQRCALTDDERAALVERMLPAYRVLLRSGDQIPVQDKGDMVHAQVSWTRIVSTVASDQCTALLITGH